MQAISATILDALAFFVALMLAPPGAQAGSKYQAGLLYLCLLAVVLAGGAATAGAGGVAYRADQDAYARYELFWVDLESGAVTKISTPLTGGGDVHGFQIDRKGKSVVYVADQGTSAINELYRVELKSGAVTKLNGMLVAGGDVRGNFQIGPKGKSVFYLADQDTDEIDELYRVDLESGAVTKLNDPLGVLRGGTRLPGRPVGEERGPARRG